MRLGEMYMELAVFLEEFQDVLQRDEAITPDLPLAAIEEWDSLAVMGTIAFFDKRFGIRLTFASFKDLSTVEDIIALSKGAVT